MTEGYLKSLNNAKFYGIYSQGQLPSNTEWPSSSISFIGLSARCCLIFQFICQVLLGLMFSHIIHLLYFYSVSMWHRKQPSDFKGSLRQLLSFSILSASHAICPINLFYCCQTSLLFSFSILHRHSFQLHCLFVSWKDECLAFKSLMFISLWILPSAMIWQLR